MNKRKSTRTINHRKFLRRLVFALILTVLLATICGCYGNISNQHTTGEEANNRQTSNQVSPSPYVAKIDEPRDSTPQVRRYTANVFMAENDSDSFLKLTDDQWHLLPNKARITTDQSGEGVLRIEGCMLIHVFQSSDLKTAPCSKSQYESGNVICNIAGASTFNNWCGGRVIIETSSARISLEGTWVAVTYLPSDQSTVSIVLKGKTKIWPVKLIKTQALGEPVEVSEGQFWFSSPGERPASINGVAARHAQSLDKLPKVVDSLKLSPRLKSIQEAAERDKVPFRRGS